MNFVKRNDTDSLTETRYNIRRDDLLVTERQQLIMNLLKNGFAPYIAYTARPAA